MDIAKIQHGIQKLLGVPVDVLTPKALPESFRERVLAEVVPVGSPLLPLTMCAVGFVGSV